MFSSILEYNMSFLKYTWPTITSFKKAIYTVSQQCYISPPLAHWIPVTFLQLFSFWWLKGLYWFLLRNPLHQSIGKMVVLQFHRRTKVEPNMKAHDGLFLRERSNTVQCNWHSKHNGSIILHTFNCWRSSPLWSQLPLGWIAKQNFLILCKLEKASTVTVTRLLMFCRLNHVGINYFSRLSKFHLQGHTILTGIWYDRAWKSWNLQWWWIDTKENLIWRVLACQVVL